jgi:hypothetical protein
MPFVSGFLRVKSGGGGNYPDNELPGMEGPVDPGYGIDLGAGIDNSLPEPPPGIWPPPSFGRPIVPIGPDNTLPVQPGTIWPSPGRPNRPDNTLPGRPPHVGGGPMPGGERPDNTLPGQPARPDNTLPSGKFWIVAGIPGLGWRYVCVDPSLSVGNELPPEPAPAPKG